jgi:rhodanese-related sulfurtransferase
MRRLAFTRSPLPDALAAVRANQGAAMIDVREESEYAAAHLKGATHLGKGTIERDIEKVFPSPDTETLFVLWRWIP